MKNKNQQDTRFEVILTEGSSWRSSGVRQILVDKQTGVNYILWQAGYGSGITPLLDSEGKPVVDISKITVKF